MLEDKVSALDINISKILAKEGIDRASQFRKYCDKTSSISMKEMWKLKKKLWPKKKSSLPIAKRNHLGRMVSSPKELMITLRQEYITRLRHRVTRPDLKDLMKLKQEVNKHKVHVAKLNKTKAWTMVELDTAVNDLNMNRARDPDGLVAELFKPDAMGSDLKLSLHTMCNNIKSEGLIPEFMRKASITTIPKSGSIFKLEDERGIFKLSVLRNLLMKLIYNRNYQMVDSNMSDSNIGGRKKRSCRDHIWILNGINHDHNSSKHKPQITVQWYDYQQMYDSMELDEAISDLYDIGIKDDTLVLLSEANRNIKLCVQTPYGLTEPHIIESVIAQGDSWALLAASVQVDSLGSQLLEEEGKQGSMDLYKYKGEVSIGILGMQDDTAAVTLAGTQAHLMNAYMNAQSATKHLRFNSKCKFMNIGAHKDIFSTSSLDVDSWETKYELDGSCRDIYIGKKEMQHTDEHKYLGFVISSDGTNLPNILSKQNKSANIIRQIKCMIECLGTYTFECAFIYMRL